MRLRQTISTGPAAPSPAGSGAAGLWLRLRQRLWLLVRLPVSKPDLRWYLRSMAAADTHYGAWSPVTRSVHAICGVDFVAPRYLPDGLHTGGWHEGPTRGRPRVRDLTLADSYRATLLATQTSTCQDTPTPGHY